MLSPLSDHLPVFMCVNFNQSRDKNIKQYRSFPVTSIAKFNEDLKDFNTSPILIESNPDSAFELLISNYNQAFANHFPLLSNKAKSRNNPWFGQELTELKHQKDKLYKKYIIKQDLI